MNQVGFNNKQYNYSNAHPAFKADEQTMNVQIPDIYYNPNPGYEQKSFKDTLKQVDVFNSFVPWLEHPILMAGSCAGLIYGLDKFQEACGGEYEKSLLGKAAKFGDNIQNSNVIQSKPVQTVLDYTKTGKNKIKHLFRNSDVINAIIKTPSKPQYSMPKQEMYNLETRAVEEFLRITSELQLGGESSDSFFGGIFGGKSNTDEVTNNFVSLKKLGLTKEERKLIKGMPKDVASNTILLKRLGKTDNEIKAIIDLGEGATAKTKQEVLKVLGLTADELAEISKNPEMYIDKVKIAAKKGAGKVWMGAAEWFPGPYQPLARRIGCDEVSNRFSSMILEEKGGAAKTATGKYISKFLQTLHRGLTFGGGKGTLILFIAPSLVETMINTKKADPDQKIGTVANGLVESVSWVFTFPLALKIMHHIGGMQYAGMSEDAVKEYRKLINEFNAKVKSKDPDIAFANHNEYKIARKELKEELKKLEKVDGQNLLTKMCRKFGKLMTVDLERPYSFRNCGFLERTARKTGGFFKNIVGTPMRLGIWGWLSMFVLGGAITKGTKAIFGNFYDGMKEEEHKEAKKQQKRFLKEDLQSRLYEAQAKKLEAAEQPSPIVEINPEIPPKALGVEEENNGINEGVNNEDTPEINEYANNVESAPIISNRPEAANQESINQGVNTAESINIPQQIQNQEPAITPAVTAPIIEESMQPNITTPNSEISNNIVPQPKKEKIDNYTYIPSSENTLKKEVNKKAEQYYIPAQTPVKIPAKTFDNSKVAKALERADRAEKMALETLSGKFGNM